MALTLIWLTVSIPFVYTAQQKQASHVKTDQSQKLPESKNATNPFGNTTEEKAPSQINLSEEYLHHHESYVYQTDNKLSHFHRHYYDVYVAYHGELLSPPPEA